MSHRPLAIVSGLTIGDYLLWNWSLNGSHDVLALVSGLTLPPLAAACVWLIALTAARLLGWATRRGQKQSRAINRSRKAVRRAATPSMRSSAPSSPAQASLTNSGRHANPRRSSSKLAA